ncbi:flagellar hook-length control protein FliK [Ponticaulis sp.]|uniref:flagellar hook-length control protein FliK n=1 Tax=Ponticaulis sp. TaxID=2020902 RepID=UPI00261EBAF6|nr:flagellar hook-length control protein FliK [Ponticaulis sp.]MDF1680052.1 flagellar hook-length control protein FliK [Ponticaulis sp.]
MNIVPFGLSVAKTVTDDPSHAFDGDAGEFAMLLAQSTAPQAVTSLNQFGPQQTSFSGLVSDVQSAFPQVAFPSNANSSSAGGDQLASKSNAPLTGVAPTADQQLNAQPAAPANGARPASGDVLAQGAQSDAAKIRSDAAPTTPIYKDSQAGAGWARPLSDAGLVSQGENNQTRTFPSQSALNVTGQPDGGAKSAIATGRVPFEGATSNASGIANTPAPSQPSQAMAQGLQSGLPAETPLKQAVPESNSFAAASTTSHGGESRTGGAQGSANTTATSTAAQPGAAAQNGSQSSSGQGNGQQGHSGPQTQAAAQAVSSSKELAASELLPEEFVQEMDLAEADAGDMQMTEAQRSAARADAALPAHLRGSAATQAAVLAQVSQKMLQKFDGKTSRFEIRLDPAELGKVDVRIEVDRDGRVQAVLAAKDAVAADALTRGLRSLENALTQAGFDLGDNGVQVELDQNNSKKSFTHSGDSEDQAELQQAASDTEQQPAEARTVTPQIQAWSRQRLDVKA